MNDQRIKKLADFFYSSDSSKEVPLRMAVTTGISGFDLGKGQFIEILRILNESKNLKVDLDCFLEEVENG